MGSQSSFVAKKITPRSNFGLKRQRSKGQRKWVRCIAEGDGVDVNLCFCQWNPKRSR